MRERTSPGHQILNGIYLPPVQVNYCSSSNHTKVGQFDGFLEIEARDELALMEAVYRLGPVSVAIDASPDAFSYYKTGVFYDKDCSNYSLDHQVGGRRGMDEGGGDMNQQVHTSTIGALYAFQAVVVRTPTSQCTRRDLCLDCFHLPP
jgi:hypothetical protein